MLTKQPKKALRLIVAIAVLTTSLFTAQSCKKDEPEKPAPTKKELLCKSWKVTEGYINGQRDSTLENSNDKITFFTDGTTNDGTWAFNSDETKIIFDKGTTDESTWDILKLESSSFVMKTTFGTNTGELHFIPVQ